MAQPCDCGAPKAPGSNRYCSDCKLFKETGPAKQAEAQAHRERMIQVYYDHGVEAPKRPHRGTWPQGYAWCSHCYRFRRQRWFSAGATQCKPCLSIKGHARMVQVNFGLAPGQYDTMMEEQGGKCAVCRRRQTAKRLAVHHDHGRGEAIALLCSRCNHDLLGAAFDSADILLCAYAVQIGGWQAVERVLDGGIDQLYRWIKDNPDALIGTKDAPF